MLLVNTFSGTEGIVPSWRKCSGPAQFRRSVRGHK